MISSTGRTAARIASVFLCIFMVFSLPGCSRVWQSAYVNGCDREIKKATKAIEAANNDVQRAAGHADRADAWAEKARYCRAFKLISSEEYDRLMGLAKRDYDEALNLTPASADFYFRRGRAHYMRAALDLTEGRKSSEFFAPAKADFSKAIEKSPSHELAFDMRGLANDATGNLDESIADFAQEAVLNPRSKYRLADEYCRRGSRYLSDKKFDPAVVDFEKAIDIETSSDPCECEPYNPLVAIYLERREYGKARMVVDRAKKAGKTVASEYQDKLNGH